LSATVGLGNIAGVGLAVALGGPGAVFWMWVIGVLGMALKMTEVTQSMLFRNTADPENPHGGPMFVAKYGFARAGLPWAGSLIGGLFVVTLLISAVTGGNMFQAWNVAEISETYFGLDRVLVGVVLAVIVGVVIIGGIRWIGRVAGVLVPFMCVIYLIAAIWVLLNNVGGIPDMLVLIVKYGLGFEDASPAGAFLGGTFGYALMFGVKRALFSSEAGQGSAPIAHAAAKTDEPVREGIVAGLEPLIDTLVVCTITALVILSTGAWDRDAVANFEDESDIRVVMVDEDGDGVQDEDDGKPVWTLETPRGLPPKTAEARRYGGIDKGETADLFADYGQRRDRSRDYNLGESFFVVVDADDDANTGRSFRRLTGELKENDAGEIVLEWGTLASDKQPVPQATRAGGVAGVYADYKGATLTAHAFDRVTPGLGMWLVSLAVWLFAISTIISWSYYGEQGMVFLTAWLGDAGSKVAILGYKLVYCVIIVITCLPIDGWLDSDATIDTWTTLGLGVMLVVNIPLMWFFGLQAMTAYNQYITRLKAGPMHDEIAPDGTTPEKRGDPMA
jgi:AGCS family alanine or glycine:cation symporter